MLNPFSYDDTLENILYIIIGTVLDVLIGLMSLIALYSFYYQLVMYIHYLFTIMVGTLILFIRTPKLFPYIYYL